jgi:hypothetical protein
MIGFLLPARFLLFAACGALLSLYLWVGWRSRTAK